MHLSTFGLTKQENTLIRYSIPAFMGMLVHPNLFKKLSICVNKVPALPDFPDQIGLVRAKDDKPPRDFNITIFGDHPPLEFLKINAHECVHIKQFATGERKDYVHPSFKVKYGGQIYDPELMDYWDMPWEIDAMDKEEGLLVRFLAEYPQYAKLCGRCLKKL